MNTPRSYPLAWPNFRPRTPAHNRRNGKFKANGSDVNIRQAAARVEDEVRLLGGKNVVISTNIEPTLSGNYGSSKGTNVDDPGSAVYFTVDGDPITLACDAYTNVAQNIAALAAHIGHTRAIERHGVQTAKEVLRGFSALPAPESDNPKDWFVVLGVKESAGPDEIREAFRSLAKKHHPDNGGTEEQMKALNHARFEGLRARGAN